MLPSTSIKPSEMCGMESSVDSYGRAEVIPVRRASAVRIVTSVRPQSTIITRTRSSLDQASPIHGHRHNNSLDSHNNSGRLSKNESPTTPISLGALIEQSRPPSSTNASLLSQDSRSSQFKQKRDTMLGFLSKRNTGGQAPKQQPHRQKLVKLDRSASKRSSTVPDPIDTRKDSMQPVTRQELDRDVAADTTTPPSPRKRNPARPSFSTLRDGPREPRITVGSLSSRPLSLSVQKSPTISKWTPSSSSSDADSKPESQHKRSATTTYIDVSTLRYDASDILDTTDDSCVDDNDLAADLEPVTTHMTKEDLAKEDLDSSSSYDSHSLNDIPQKVMHAGNRTLWLNETESDDLPELSSPVSTIRPQSSLIYWSPSKEARLSMIERSTTDQSEEENWPLPAIQPELRPLEESDEQVLPGDMARIVSHFSSKSQDTTSSGSTVLSPTFSHDQGRSTTADSTPMVSPVVETKQQTAPLDPSVQDDNASIAPSDISTQWKRSAKERLGLGGIVRKAEPVPWEQITPTPRLQKPAKQAPKRSSSTRFSSLMKWRNQALDDIYQKERQLMSAERQGRELVSP
ncbi:hypothetical protein AMS68_002589 [Peltaster fructicola]|uniref:Uncharacterized protein n=1 Tax=Peltaster fructicola TaxID=286661 RepID=A0A6H0XQM4_9PEZI|nr:hypothetical protein AMS68_002589 [Peltaster fructicola]